MDCFLFFLLNPSSILESVSFQFCALNPSWIRFSSSLLTSRAWSTPVDSKQSFPLWSHSVRTSSQCVHKELQSENPPKSQSAHTRMYVHLHTHTLCPFLHCISCSIQIAFFLFLDHVLFLFTFSYILRYSFSFAFRCFVRETFLFSHKLYYISLDNRITTL